MKLKQKFVDEASTANKYIALLRSQADMGYDYASRVMSLPKTWFTGLFLSGLMFFVFYISSYMTSIWGLNEAASVLDKASKEELAPMMKAVDPDIGKSNVVFDFKRGVLSSANFNDGSSGLWNNLYNYFTSNNGQVAEPGSVTGYLVVDPSGTERLINEAVPLPAIQMKIDDVIGDRNCKLDAVEARQYLCERGIINNRRAKRALGTLKYCQREMDKPEGCSLWRQCTKKIIRDNYSSDVKTGIVPPSTVNLGRGKVANIPLDLC